MLRWRTARVVAAAFICLWAPTAAVAEWQVKPFIGAEYSADTTYNGLVASSLHPHVTFGANGTWLGEIFGIEGDFAHTHAIFDVDSGLASDSGVTTITGNVVAAVPRRLAQYSLRPYLVGGAGMMHIRIDYAGDTSGALAVRRNLQAMDLGGGVSGFLTPHVGLNWDVRYFRSIDRTIQSGQSVGSEHLSFWRATMAVAIRL